MANENITKQERRQLRYQEKQAARNSAARFAKKKQLTWWLIAAAILICIVGGIWWLSSNVSTSDPLALREGDWIKGKNDAPMTLIEYSDFQCPACGAYYPLVKELESKYSEQLAIVYRHYPLKQLHPRAERAAQAAEAAGLQGKFWEMHDALFEYQDAWSSNGSADDYFTDYAKNLGLDEEQFRRDLDSQVVRDKVRQDENSGAKLLVSGTPSFFLNGQKIDNPRSLEEFSALIDQAIAAQPTEPKPEETATTSVHWHANLAVYLQGKKFDFSAPRYQVSEDEEHVDDGHSHDENVHFHDNNGEVVHVHSMGITLGYFLQSLNINLTDSCLQMDTGENFCNDEKNSLQVLVNGARIFAPADYAMQDLDRVLISYGDLDEAGLRTQIDSVADDACIYSEKCPERGTPPSEECVGGLGSEC